MRLNLDQARSLILAANISYIFPSFPSPISTVVTSCAKLCILLKSPTISKDLEALRLGHQGSSCTKQW